MAINFPSSPSNGDEFIDAGSGTEWVYNSADKSWTMTGAGSSSPFNFRGGYDFRTNNTISDLESGDLFIHEGADGTVGSGYVGLSGQITSGTLVLWDGDEFIKLSSSVPGYPDIDDPNYQNGTLDSRYLCLAADAGAQVVQSDDPTEFAGGVKVTGGSKADVGYGIRQNSTNLMLVNNGHDSVFVGPGGKTIINSVENPTAFKVEGSSSTNATNCQFSILENTYNGDCATYFGVQAAHTINGAVTANSYGFYVPALKGTGTVKNFKAFAANGDPISDEAYGFFSSMTNGTDRYNFYGGSPAPSYLRGSTYIGGTTARNTFDLWKSTLTEEQLEQLEAGTLVAPANVSTPGDGSFARQWYYDQQDAETQAELTAGTLEYPEHLAAATFTDTFDLGDNTKLDLLNNGYIHQTGIQWRGAGSSSYVDSKGFFYSLSRGSVVSVNSSKTAGEQVRGIVVRVDTVADDDGDPVDVGDAHVYVAETPLNADTGKINDWIGFSCNAPNESFSTGSITGKPYGFYSGISEAGGYNFYAAGTAPNYFAGLVESEGGVKVSGGSRNDVKEGLYYDNGINVTSEERLVFNLQAKDESIYTSNAFNSLIQTSLTIADDFAAKKIRGFDSRINISDATYSAKEIVSVCGRLFGANSAFNNQGDVDIYKAFEAEPYSISDGWGKGHGKITGAAYGFYSDITKTGSITGDAYNFYAEGAAPNYFAGQIRLPGTSSSVIINHDPIDGSSNDPFALDNGVELKTGTLKISNKDGTSLQLKRETDGILAMFYQGAPNVNPQKGSISVDAAGVSFNETSDYRLKSNIVDLSAASEVVKTLQPRTYSIGGLNNVSGFIAHELQAVVPRAVTGTKDAEEAIGTLVDYDGTVLETAVVEPPAEELTYTEDVEVDGVTTATVRTRTWTATGTQPVYQGVDQTKLIPLLTKALQEALERIEALEAAATA